MSRKTDPSEPIIIKKYANRRLYDTETSSYVTLEDLCVMVKQDKAFVVRDAKTNEDLTRQILTQIILEQELKGSGMMPPDFLRGVIRMHDEQMGAMMQHYLDSSMKTFAENQDRFRGFVEKGMEQFKGLSPINQMEELAKRNMDLMQKTMEMFNPGAFFNPGQDPDKKK
ncbi:MAG: polyhydroxyalkanoate synthesis repressor PhaR [Alphaproteobacteria bacterium]|nr:polyhydroxyalkanoate synthesis repressor PhaR [Alphaproteobacteria bacterium]